jgi:putative sporulation protein YyaC
MRVEGWGAHMPRGATQREARARLDDHDAAERLGHFLRQELERLGEGWRGAPVVLCIGSDRSTGDALGPLVGSLLLEHGLPRDQVAGDLSLPVHASNLRRVWAELRQRRPRGAVIAVDACLGRQESVGTLTAGLGPLRPGAGVNKDLPPVGDVFLTGTVNVSGFMEYFVLQNTRLSLVVAMARRMTGAVLAALGRPVPAALTPLSGVGIGLRLAGDGTGA